MSAAYVLDVGELHTLNCAGCGVAFAISEDLNRRRLQDGKEFYCPNGHTNVYNNNENARLKHELEQTKKKLEWKAQEVLRAEDRVSAAKGLAARIEKQRRSQKAATTKLRKRACAGLCPLCQKPMPDLAAHVEQAHPHAEKRRA